MASAPCTLSGSLKSVCLDRYNAELITLVRMVAPATQDLTDAEWALIGSKNTNSSRRPNAYLKQRRARRKLARDAVSLGVVV